MSLHLDSSLLHTSLYRFTAISNQALGAMTTSAGAKVSTDIDSLKAGLSGPALLEDFMHLDKMQHFDRERIPERVVHARGVGAHGYFECTNPATDITMASLFKKVRKGAKQLLGVR